MPRLGWKRIGSLVTAIGAGLLITMMLRAPSGQAPSAEVTDPGFDGVAADIADPLARSTLLDHEESLRREQLESMRCARGDESYRIRYEAGLFGGQTRIVELTVWRGGASATERTLDCSSRPGHRDACGWRRSQFGKIQTADVTAISEALTSVLKAHTAPQIDDRETDASRVFVEACRNNRYHFYTRALDLDDASEAAGVALLARKILQLTRKDQTSTDTH